MEANQEQLLDIQIAKAETAKRRQFNPYRKVMGKDPNATEMAAWSHDKWMDYIRFVMLFIKTDEKTGKDVFTYSKEKREEANEFLTIPDHPFQEFIYRIDKWPDEHTSQAFGQKFQSIYRNTLGYLKLHPSIISPNMKILIESREKIQWVLNQYKLEQTHAGNILARDTGTDTPTDVKLPSLQVKLMNSLVVMADFYERIANSVSEEEIKKMNLTEKVKTLKDLSFVFATSTKKQSTNHLTQININTKDVKGVEEAMLDYVKKSQEK